MDAQTLLVLLLLIAIYDETPQLFRASWTRKKPMINPIQLALNNRSEFINMTRFDISTFLTEIVDPFRHILNRSNYQVIGWLNGNNNILYGPDVKNRLKTLSLENRFMRMLMFCQNYKIIALEKLFGQKKSVIYEDAFLLMRAMVKLWANRLELSTIDTLEYLQLVGAGTLRGIFDSAVYIIDGHKVRILKPPRSQRDFYCGRKGFHCLNYLFVVDGLNHTARYIHGGERGAENDITLLHRSTFYQHRNQLIAPGHWVLCDGAWRNEGPPFLCRFTDREYLTAAQQAYNYALSEQRVLPENYFARLHNLFPILNYFKLRLDKADIFVRGLSLITNIHIIHQSPLRN